MYLESEPEVLKRVQDAVRAAAAKADPEEEFNPGEEEFDLRDFEVADEND